MFQKDIGVMQLQHNPSLMLEPETGSDVTVQLHGSDFADMLLALSLMAIGDKSNKHIPLILPKQC